MMMNRENSTKKFEKMGAKLGFAPTIDPRGRPRIGLSNDVVSHDPALVRQGECFFLSVRDFNPSTNVVLRNEPLVRGGGKPHLAAELVRFGGDRVYVTGRYPSGMSEARYRRILAVNPAARSWSWRVMVRNPSVFVRGAIGHPDHETVVLKHWYRVEMGVEVFTETVALLD